MANGVSRRAMCDIYDYIYKYTLEHQYPPCIVEICEGTMYASTQTVGKALRMLEEEGKIETDLTLRQPRAYRITALKVVRSDIDAT